MFRNYIIGGLIEEKVVLETDILRSQQLSCGGRTSPKMKSCTVYIHVPKRNLGSIQNEAKISDNLYQQDYTHTPLLFIGNVTLYCFFVQFSSFPIFNFGIVHYGSRPFIYILHERLALSVSHGVAVHRDAPRGVWDLEGFQYIIAVHT